VSGELRDEEERIEQVQFGRGHEVAVVERVLLNGITRASDLAGVEKAQPKRRLRTVSVRTGKPHSMERSP